MPLPRTHAHIIGKFIIVQIIMVEGGTIVRIKGLFQLLKRGYHEHGLLLMNSITRVTLQSPVITP